MSTTIQSADLSQALHDPAAAFDTPQAVVAAQRFNRSEKIKILRQWEYDIREMDVAAEENMAGEKRTSLNEVIDALSELGVDHGSDVGATKQGGA